jgi:glycosyltransferase involved in cell wall biosynthesis
MNIVIVNRRYFESTGPERYLFAIKERLEKDGHLVAPFSVRLKWNKKNPYMSYFVSPPADEETLYFKDYKDKLNFFQKFRVLANSVYSLEAKRKLGRLIDDHNIDLVYLLGIATSISPSVIDAAKKRRIPVVMRTSDFFMFCAVNIFSRDGSICRECETYGYKRALKYRCLKNSLTVTGVKVLSMYIHKWLKIYDKVDAFIAPSLCMRDAFLKAGYPEEKIHHIPSFFNCHAVEPCYENDGYILYFGRVDRDKGIINLIKAYEIGKFNVPLLIAGGSSDGEDKRLMQYVQEKRITNVNFVGFKKLQELIPLIQRAMFTVVPSLCLDNSPMSVLESMACGKPVIGSNLGGIAEEITPQSGILIPPNDPIALASAINSLLSSPQKIVDMGKEARKRVEEEYSLETHYTRLLGVFKRLINKK